MPKLTNHIQGLVEPELIPGDWRISLLDSVAKRGSGHTPDRKIPRYWDGGIKWVSLADSDKLDKVYIGETMYNISEEGIARSSTVLHPKGTVILSRDAGIGKSAILKEDMAVSQHFIAWKTGDSLSNLFLYYWLQAMKSEFERIAVGSTIKTIGLPFFKKLQLLLPPLPEQRAIAAILSTWDDAIALTGRLIDALKRRKQALMQLLLTGKVRFPAFAGEVWETIPLGTLFIERRETGFIDLPLVSVTGNGIVYRDTLERRDSSNEDKSKYLRICRGDIGYNTMRMWQGVSGVSSIEGIVSPAYTILIPQDRVNVDFMGYLFKLPETIRIFRRHSQGLVDDTLSLKFDHLARISVSIPEYREQVRIAEVLQTADLEIAGAGKKLETLQTQKRALMQRLLTGQVRVMV